MNTILPIGSVVKVRNLKKLMMIFGFLQSHGAQPDVCFDYVGVPYPEGNIDLRAHLDFRGAILNRCFLKDIGQRILKE